MPSLILETSTLHMITAKTLDKPFKGFHHLAPTCFGILNSNIPQPTHNTSQLAESSVFQSNCATSPTVFCPLVSSWPESVASSVGQNSSLVKKKSKGCYCQMKKKADSNPDSLELHGLL